MACSQRKVEWLHGLNLEPVESYLRVLKPLDDEIKFLSKQLKGLAEDDEDVKLLMTIPGLAIIRLCLSKARSEMSAVFLLVIGFAVTLALFLLRMRLAHRLGMEASLRKVAGGCVG
jgi:hypothetical protein